MHRWTTSARLAVAATVVVAVSAAITPAVAQTSDPTRAVTVFLKAPHLAALQRLAHAQGLTHAQRMRELRRLLPTAAQHAEAVSALRSEGLTVTGQNAWSVSASAASSTMAKTFGTRPTATARSSAAARRAAAGPYPDLPASLQSVATAAYPTTGGPAVSHPQDTTCPGCLTGTDFRNAYASPAKLPTSGQDANATLTIATIQLAAWNPGDLVNWANTSGNVDGPSYSQDQNLTVVPVDQTSVPTPTTNDDGDVEVDLDQEAILGTDPYAHQRPYFAPNTAAGQADAYAQVVDDVLQDANAYQGGDSHIVALSTSWGQCEADTGASYIKVLEPILTSLVAAGVTIFAASGDQGIYDECNFADSDVDYPAASPEVVAVGGTNLAALPSNQHSNNGTNWAESAWTCSSFSACAGDHATGGSGGGVSQFFAKPAYQSAITTKPFAAATARLVPDISADADPSTGFRIYTTDPSDTKLGNNYLQIGGTSLAAPASAALFTNLLAANGATSGIGDIHKGLYNAYAANVGAYRDVTVGSNGAVTDAGADPSVNAAPGYDTVTGLGAPLWPAIASYLFAAEPTLPPKATSAMVLTNPGSTTLSRQVTATWGSVESASNVAIQSDSVTIVRDGQSTPVYTNDAASPAGDYTFTGVAGASYTMTVVAQDAQGNTSRPVTSTISVPIDDKAFRFSGQWHRLSSPSSYTGSAAITNARNSYATATARGETYALLVRTGPNFGKLRISWNSFTLMTVSLYSASPGSKLIPFFNSNNRQLRTFKFLVLGYAGSPSYGANVGLDGLTVGY